MSQNKQGGQSLDARKLDAAYTGFHAAFFKSLANAPSFFNTISAVVTDDRPFNVWNWISQVPKMRKWVGQKRLHKLRAEKHQMECEPYESSIQVPKEDIINDRLGLWSRQINDMGSAHPRHLDDLVITALIAGFAATVGRTYDGQFLLDTDHTADGNGQGVSQSNLLTGALSFAKYREAYKRMAYEFVDDQGEPVVNVPGYLVVGVQNADIGRDILQRQWIAGVNGAGSGANVQLENLERGTVELIVTPRITDTKWFLLARNPTAVVMQRKRGPDFYSVGEDGLRGGPTNPHTFMTGNVLYGIESEEGVAYGAWQDVVGGLGT